MSVWCFWNTICNKNVRVLKNQSAGLKRISFTDHPHRAPRLHLHVVTFDKNMHDKRALDEVNNQKTMQILAWLQNQPFCESVLSHLV